MTYFSNMLQVGGSFFNRLRSWWTKDSSDSTIYKFGQAEKGIALLIHNENFVKQSDRTGDEKDRENLKTVFKELGFKTLSFKNQNADEMLKIGADVANKGVHKKSDCFVCVIASHGGEKQTNSDTHQSSLSREHEILGVDGEGIKTSDFIDIFSDDKCKNLSGKPKFFFIQSCRASGEGKMDEGYLFNTVQNEMISRETNKQNKVDAVAIEKDKQIHIVSSLTNSRVPASEGTYREGMDANGSKLDEHIPMITMVPCPENTLIMFAALSGNYAVRSENEGGWMLSELYKCLSKYVNDECTLEKTNFLDILTEVLAGMNKHEFTSSDWHLNRFDGNFSPGCLTHRLTRDVYFKKNWFRMIKQDIFETLDTVIKMFY